MQLLHFTFYILHFTFLSSKIKLHS